MSSELFGALAPTLAYQGTKGNGDGEENGDGVGDEMERERWMNKGWKKQLIEDADREIKECLVELKKGFPATVADVDRICDVQKNLRFLF